MTDDAMGRTAAVAVRDDDASIELGDLTGGQSEAFCCHDAMRAHAAEAEGCDPEVVDPDDVEMLQDLVLAAVNEALRGVAQQGEARLASATGGLSIPGLF